MKHTPTIMAFRKYKKWKAVRALLPENSLEIVDGIYLGFEGSLYEQACLETRLDNLDLDPQTESKVFSIFRN